MTAQQPLLTIKVLTVLNHTNPTHLHPIGLDLDSHAEHIGLPFFHLSHDRTFHHFISHDNHTLFKSTPSQTHTSQTYTYIPPSVHQNVPRISLVLPPSHLRQRCSFLVRSLTPSSLHPSLFLSASLPLCLFHPPICSPFDFTFFAPGDAQSSITTPIIACWPPTFSLSSESSSD